MLSRALPPPGGRLSKARTDSLVVIVMGLLLAGDPPTPFTHEGATRAALRAAIILQGGWRWHEADSAVRAVLTEALRRIGAKRPSWKEASTPHYAQADAFTLFERTRCRNCGSKLPPENRVHCSVRCNQAFHVRMKRAEDAAFRTTMEEWL